MLTSTAACSSAGSMSPMSSTIGKLSVWSDASCSDCVPLPPPHAAASDGAPTAIASDRKTYERSNVTSLASQLEETRRQPLPPRYPSPSSRLGLRGESAPATDDCHLAMAPSMGQGSVGFEICQERYSEKSTPRDWSGIISR